MIGLYVKIKECVLVQTWFDIFTATYFCCPPSKYQQIRLCSSNVKHSPCIFFFFKWVLILSPRLGYMCPIWLYKECVRSKTVSYVSTEVKQRSLSHTFWSASEHEWIFFNALSDLQLFCGDFGFCLLLLWVFFSFDVKTEDYHGYVPEWNKNVGSCDWVAWGGGRIPSCFLFLGRALTLGSLVCASGLT